MKQTEFKGSLRDVVKSVLLRDLRRIKNKKVLEVGCGTWDFAKKILEKNGCEWHGFEPVDLGKENLTIVKGSVKNIPYHDNSFDLVLCNQTMEHWFEYNVSLKRALAEIHRVLKPGGVLMVNSPIHLHGDPRFLRGEIKKIIANFSRKFWKIQHVERVFPDKILKTWKKISGKGVFSKVGYPDFLIPNAKSARTHILNIHARKKKTSSGLSKRDSFRNLKVIIRFVKTYAKTRMV